MKNLKTIITVIAISLSTIFSVTASEKKPLKTKINKQLRTEIISLLGNKIQLEVKKDKTAEVSFVINNKNELVVISVSSKVEELNSFVKNKLNYKKLTVKGIKKGEIYRMPIKIKQS